ncbi:transmembrane cytochrome oxidase associated protein [Pseudoalteromonas luteoviolacea]|uniref:transmembrane cytochrome oxidase associated protein n=1 Tax=Pseudoalteromonas luteoviolacea TaxID=43657 RepID=UPI001B37FA47|nr:transmembrane cytochrome oxidase associated protein [Pseudoalteromonas luteoviolacea]MBQ4839521.1 transmembrane cytochrome oxidase associated protein [Pseudoalteromonas luteoviolacea]
MNKTLWLFIGCFLLPVIMAFTVLKLDFRPSSTTNNGNFLEHEIWLPIQQDDKLWTIVLNLPSGCASACAVQKSNAQNLHVALGKNRSKVSIVMVGTDELAIEQSVQEKLTPASFYLVNKQGLVVLEYLYKPDPEANRLVLKGLLKDMKKLLNYARSQ